MTYTTKAIDDRDRVIARLLDGWAAFERPVDEWLWRRAEGGIDHHRFAFEPMSDGEAAIIRAHQERT